LGRAARTYCCVCRWVIEGCITSKGEPSLPDLQQRLLPDRLSKQAVLGQLKQAHRPREHHSQARKLGHSRQRHRWHSRQLEDEVPPERPPGDGLQRESDSRSVTELGRYPPEEEGIQAVVEALAHVCKQHNSRHGPLRLLTAPHRRQLRKQETVFPQEAVRQAENPLWQADILVEPYGAADDLTVVRSFLAAP